MDSLGQGVSKQNGRVTFIAKTLPGECGTALLQSRKKGVQFAVPERIDQPADNRINPECPHFAECPGCDYLHSDYTSELGYKKAALAGALQALPLPSEGVEVIAAGQRFAYRNRIQLHYRHRYLGMLDGANDQVLEIPDCRLPEPALQEAMQRLYQDKSWTREHSGQGHCELSLKEDGEVHIAWNQPYAQGGFTQVNRAMNAVLQAETAEAVLAQQPQHLLDLFAGNGNLSRAIAKAGVETSRVDVGDYDDARFIRQDLYADDALARVKNKTRPRFDAMLLDPPRKGFAALADWVGAFRPRQLVYVSCNAATLARDLQSLAQVQKRMQIERVVLLDMFPGTRHFETLVSVRLSD